MKLEVGMYVRTKWGTNKINEYVPKSGQLYLETDVCHKSNVIKASHNIIDLIEENDLVTLTSKYCERDIYRVEGKFGEYISLDTLGDGTLIISNSKDINSIVTKEQFEAMQYKVVEE